MPRSSRSSRPAPRPSAPSRGAHTAALPTPAPLAKAPSPPAKAPAPGASQATAAQPSQPGLFGQMAATAGSVAVGSTIGHGISNMLFGSGGQPAAPEAQQAPTQDQQQQNQFAVACGPQAKEFTECLQKADLPSCTWYLEQLNACRAAASQY